MPKKADYKKARVTIIDPKGFETNANMEVVSVSESNIVIKEVIPEMKTILIAGEKVEIDVGLLKKMDRRSKHKGYHVSKLLSAAELA